MNIFKLHTVMLFVINYSDDIDYSIVKYNIKSKNNSSIFCFFAFLHHKL